MIGDRKGLLEDFEGDILQLEKLIEINKENTNLLKELNSI